MFPRRLLLIALAGILLLACSIRGWCGAAYDHHHALLRRVLAGFVRDGRVDYVGLKSGSVDLDAWLARTARVGAPEFLEFTPHQQLALLINLYNARTLRLILDYHPLKSIREIGFLPGAAWKKKIVEFRGTTISLDDLENSLIRQMYNEPRVHFALVCAARGCPILRHEPYVSERLDQQLADQTRRFLRMPARNRYDAASHTLWLSPIFKWYGMDFRDGGQLIQDFVHPYLPAEATWPADAVPPRIKFTDYDWALNDGPPVPPAVSPLPTVGSAPPPAR